MRALNACGVLLCCALLLCDGSALGQSTESSASESATAADSEPSKADSEPAKSLRRTEEQGLSSAPPPDLKPGLWPTLAALGPGFFVRGAGAFVAGDRRTAKRLLISEGLTLSVFLGASSVIALSGASRRLVGPMVPLVATGGSLFLLSWVADIYAASTGGRDVHAVSWVTPFAAELGYRYVYDPQFEYRNFAYTQVDLRAGPVRVTPSVWAAIDDDNVRARVDGAYRVYGRTDSRSARDGSFVEIADAVTLHRYGTEEFSVWTMEGRVDGRLDLARVGHTLRGSFAEAQLGAGLELYDFDVPGARFGDDASGLLLARFGFGMYFGDGVSRTGEAVFYYDHRHDDYAAGLGTTGIGGGFLGHVGAEGHHFVRDQWALTWLFEVGSAYIGGVGVRYRYRPSEVL